MNASLNPAQPVGPDVDRESALPMFWLLLLAAISAVGLLFAFQQVVHAAVDRAASKQISASAEARNAWLCKTAPTQAERQACVSPQSSGPHNANSTARVTHATFQAAVPSLP